MALATVLSPDRDLTAEVQRTAEVLLDDALGRLPVADDDPVEAVHEFRKRNKELRGLVRLVRPGLAAYHDANRLARDASRAVSGVRDAHALLETFDVLVAVREELLGEVGPIRDGLRRRAERASDPEIVAEQVDTAVSLEQELAATVPRWVVDGEPAEVIAGGVAKTYGRARSAMDAAIAEPVPERFHEWRKRVKYGWYHLQLLREALPDLLAPAASVQHDLADALGDAHDLAVLAGTLRNAPDEFGGTMVVERFLTCSASVRLDLEARALRLGARLHAEEADATGRRLGAIWDAACRWGPLEDAGELDDVFEPVDDGLHDMTAADLRRRAARADVPGRSSMRKDELVAAVRASGA